MLSSTIKIKIKIIQAKIKKDYGIDLTIDFEQGRWHHKGKVRWIGTDEKSRGYIFSETPSGCGTLIFHNYYPCNHWSIIANKKSEEDILGEDKIIAEELIKLLRSQGIGALITTVGETIMLGETKILLQTIFNFKKVQTYKNHLHGQAEQSLYIHIIE